MHVYVCAIAYPTADVCVRAVCARVVCAGRVCWVRRRHWHRNVLACAVRVVLCVRCAVLCCLVSCSDVMCCVVVHCVVVWCAGVPCDVSGVPCSVVARYTMACRGVCRAMCNVCCAFPAWYA